MDIIKKNREIEDALQYEVEFFKKEVARLSKGGVVAASPGVVGDKNFFTARDDGTGSFKNMMGELATPI